MFEAIRKHAPNCRFYRWFFRTIWKSERCATNRNDSIPSSLSLRGSESFRIRNHTKLQESYDMFLVQESLITKAQEGLNSSLKGHYDRSKNCARI